MTDAEAVFAAMSRQCPICKGRVVPDPFRLGTSDIEHDYLLCLTCGRLITEDEATGRVAYLPYGTAEA